MATDKPDDYRELIQKEKQEKTGRLNLGNSGLTDWPTELFELTWLTHLKKSSNKSTRQILFY